MKSIEVSAAVILKQGKILATQRGYGNYAGSWEFPGGKLEPGETAEAATVREIKEELEVDIHVDSHLITIQYDYPEFHLTMHCFLCTMADEDLVLTEHLAAKWLGAADIDSVDWLAADIQVIDAIKAANILK